MKRTGRIASSIFMLLLGLLGIYCSVRGFMARRDLHGAIDVDDTVRDWSMGATACVVACGVIATVAWKKK